MTRDDIRVGTRGSALALAQARLVTEALERTGQRSRLVIIETQGDRRAPDTVWGEGAFVTAIAEAVLDGRVDVAVHSAKDIPTAEDPRLRIAAYLRRGDPRDGLIVRDGAAADLDTLPMGSRIGTDSPRRTGFLLARRPDLQVHSLHGNVDTRLRRLDAGETDGLVLACAGLDRLGLGERIAQRIDPELLPPAPGQGAVAVQVRGDDDRMVALAGAIDHPATRLAVEAERAFLTASGGGCRAPIGALAEVAQGELALLGGFARPDGSATAVGRRRGSPGEAGRLARALAAELGSQFRRRGRSAEAPDHPRPDARRVIVTRAVEQAGDLTQALSDAGLEAVPVPTIAIDPEPPGGDLDRCARRLDTYRWVVVTSANGARAILGAASRVVADLDAPGWAVIGPATRAILEAEGVEIDVQPRKSAALALAAALPVGPGDRVLVVRGDLADQELGIAFRARGAEVDDVIAYRTREAPEGSRELLRLAIAGGPIAAAVFTSGSTVRGLLSLAEEVSVEVRSIPAVCIGPETAAEARSAGFRILAVPPTPDSTALAAATARAIAPQPQETG